jgi:uncharacterized membrane protein YdjX (TVP38/TMEM64 family)
MGQRLTLEGLRGMHATLQAWHTQQPLLTAAGFFLVFVGAFTLALPLGTLLSLAGGAIFGFWWGLLLVSFASSLGALLCFLGARYLLRDRVRQRLGHRLEGIQQGIERDGAWYLLALRLFPLLPPMVINPVLGLTRMKAHTYYLVTQLGGLLVGALYVNAGTQLAQLADPADVLSPGLLGSLALLALLALATRLLMRRMAAGSIRHRGGTKQHGS